MFIILGADGREYGPVTLEQLKTWLAQGRANHETKAKRPEEGVWKSLGEFPEFAGNVPPSSNAGQPAPKPIYPETMPLASRWLRLGARLLDGLASLLCLGPGLAAIFIPLFREIATAGSPENMDFRALLIGVPIFLLGLAVYATVQIWLLTTRGQSLGKLILKIRIVRIEDESNPGFVHAVVLRGVVPWAIGALVGPFSLVDVCFIFRDDKRCIHDLIASTKVVVVV